MWVGDIGLYVYNVGGGKHRCLSRATAPTLNTHQCPNLLVLFFHFPIRADLTSHQRDQKAFFFFFFFINQNIKGQFGFKKNHHSSFLTQFLSLIIYHLKYPNFLNPTCLAHCFQLLITQIFVLSVEPIPEQLAKDFH